MYRSKHFKAYCAKWAHRIALAIYGARMVTVPPAGVKRFAMRLYRSAKGATSEDELNDAMLQVQIAILSEYTYHSIRMWKFCDGAVIRLFFQLAIQHSWVRFENFPRRSFQKRLFGVLRKASDDADVNARVDAFFTRVHGEYTIVSRSL
jgi:hypothetical protein